MGAHSITRYVITDKSLNEAWGGVWRDERDEHGSDAYSGSFATCSGVEQIAGIMGIGEAELVAEAMFCEDTLPVGVRSKLYGHIADSDGRILREPQKWGAAFAIPVCAASGTKSRSGSTSVAHTNAGHLDSRTLTALVTAKVNVPSGSWLANLRIESDKVRTAHTVQRATGKSTTTWVICDESGAPLRPRAQYATEREAIVAAKLYVAARLESGWQQRGESVEICALRKRESGLTKVSGEVAARTTKISYEIITPTSVTQGGWYFFGWAAS